MRSIMALLVMALLTLAPDAWGACAQPYDSNALLSDLVMVETAVRKNDGTTARQVADKMEAGFACMTQPIPYMIVARAYRAVGAGKVLGGDEARGKQWFLTAIEVDPGFEYGLEDMAENNPVRYAYESVRDAAEVAPTELKGFNLKKGTNYLDGSLLGSPTATLGRPHLFQTDALSGSLQSFIIDGNKFPDAALVAQAPPQVATVEPEKGKKSKKSKQKPSKEAKAKEKPAKEATASNGKPAKEAKSSNEKPAKEAAASNEKPAKEAKSSNEKPAKEAKQKKAKKQNPVSSVDTGGFYQRKRPPEKTPLIIGGAVTVVGSAALYYWSSRTHKQFDDATTEQNVNKYKAMTNRLVISSAAILAGGAGVLTWGIILDDQGRPLPGIHFQF